MLVVALWAQRRQAVPARVREVSPRVDPTTRTFAVRVTIDDADASVQWGMTANVGVMAVDRTSVALLPLTSIYHHEGKPAVWRYDPANGKVAISPVEIGQYREDGVLVTSGVRNGDWIVTAGVHKLIPARSCGRTKVPAAGTAPCRRAPALALTCRYERTPEPTARLALQPLRVGAQQPHARALFHPRVRVAGRARVRALGQSEDPPFTFRVMVVKTMWPGATAHDVEQQVTDRVERKLQEVPNVDYVRSYSKPASRSCSSRSRIRRRRRPPPTRSTRCARRSATSATSFPRASRVRSSTTSSATRTPTSTR
jgi:hypothetical protein